MDAHREHLDALLTPSSTYMDLNIGAALWLAASAEGWMQQHQAACSRQPRCTVGPAGRPMSDSEVTSLSSPTPIRTHGCCSGETRGERLLAAAPPAGHVWYRSQARVLLVGAGADEQCGTWACLPPRPIFLPRCSGRS